MAEKFLNCLCKVFEVREELLQIRKEVIEAHPGETIVIGRGMDNPDILFIGEGLGEQECKELSPFVGKAGKTLDSWLEAQKIDKYFITNSVFFMPKDVYGHFRKPTDQEVEEFRPYVKRIIEAVRPKRIILLGDAACQSLMRKKIADCRNTTLDYNGIPVQAIYHPSYFMRNKMTGIEHFKDLFNYQERKLVYDTETNSKIPEIAKLRLFGCYSYLTDKVYIFDRIQGTQIQDMIARHNVFIGFNNEKYDNVVLKNPENGGYTLPGINVDMYKAVSARGKKGVMGLDNCDNLKLNTICQFLGLGKKVEVPSYFYTKEDLTPEEMELFKKYLHQDVLLHKALFEWGDKWAEPFRLYMSAKNVREYKHLTASIASMAYKAMCFSCGIPETYNDFGHDEKEKFEGAFIAVDKEMYRGTVLEFDFSSLYPHAILQCNLCSPVKEGYTGKVFEKNEFFPELQGRYIADYQGDKEKTLVKWFQDRLVFKANKDKREYSVKILSNSYYGTTANPTFRNSYYLTTAPDTTYFGRTSIKYVRKRFTDEGFDNILSHTDSLYVGVPQGKTIEQAKELAKQIILDIQKWVPFPSPTMELTFKREIKYIQTFPKDDNTYKKSFYLYVDSNNELTVKGLPVVKSNSTQISKEIFARIKQQIIERLDCKFDRKLIDDMIQELISKDMKLLAARFECKNPKFYKSETDIHAQIAKTYGEGIHYLVKNRRQGLGKSVRWCSMEQAKSLKVSDLDLSNIYSELKYFMVNPPTDYKPIILERGQKTLGECGVEEEETKEKGAWVW